MTDPTARTAKEHTGAMIALMLDASDSAALLSALPPDVAPVVDGDGLHLTLLYLGDTRAIGDLQDVVGAVLQVMALEHGTLTGLVSGVGRFTNDEGDGTNAVYASFDAWDLPGLRQNLVDRLAEVGVMSPSQHGFTPHITLAFVPADVPTPPVDPPALKLTFRALTLMWGGERTDYPLLGGGFMVTKGLDGRMRWVLISSNSFQDREQEIVSQKALEADVERADKEGDYGTLDWWHLDGYPDKNSGEPTPLAVLGHCTGNAMHGRMLIEWGDFVSDDVGQAIKAIAPDLAASIAFLYPKGEPDAQGTYHHIRRYSRALLPKRFASNPLTALPIIVQEEKHMVKEKVAALKAVLGGDDELVNKVLALAGSKEQAALDAGVRHKEADAAAAQKATITVSDDDKPADKPKDEKPPEGAAAAEDKPAAAAEGEPPAADPNAPPAPGTIGHYTEQQLAEYVSKCIDAKMETMKGDQAQAAAAKEAQGAELLQTIKEQGQKLDHILAEVAAVKTAADNATAGAATALEGVAELKGETPRAQAGHRASKEGPAPSTGIQQQTEGPQADPMEKHWNAIFRSAASPVPGQ